MDDRLAFLETLFPQALRDLDGCIHLRLIPEDRQVRARSLNLDSIEAVASLEQPEGVHLYIAPVLRIAGKGSGTKAGVLASSVLWADIDAKGEGELTLSAAVQQATESGYPPTLVVQSGASPERGHLYWRLAEPFALNGEGLAAFEGLLKRIAGALSGDRACAEAARVMRLPGSLNCKAAYGPEFPATRLLEHVPERIYTWDAINLSVPQPAAPEKPRKATSSAGVLPVPPTGDINALLGCAFIQHAIRDAANLSEPLWLRMLWTLAPKGEAGLEMAHTWSADHPNYDAKEVDRLVGYAREKGYKAPSCKNIVGVGFNCPHYDACSERCTAFRARRPLDLLDPIPQEGEAFLQGRRTYIVTRDGIREVASFIVRVEREVRAAVGNRVQGTIVCADGFTVEFDWLAEDLGDNRSLSRNLAALLATRFICAARSLSAAKDAWLRASDAKQILLSSEFGFSRDGDAFVDADLSLPEGAPLLALPELLAASRLGLARQEERILRRLAVLLCRTWPQVTDSAELVAFLLGMVGWSLMAPVLEAQDPGVRPLIGWLLGDSGVGKTTHCRLAQCFFGDFSTENALVSFASTAMGIEEEAYWFRALMVINDVKRSTMRPGDESALLSFVQRAADRDSRRRLNTAGQASGGKPSRATLLFNGEDQVIQDTSALARVLAFPVHAPADHPEGIRQLELHARYFSMVTRCLVERLLASPHWVEAALARYHQHTAEIAGHLGPVRNRHRMAKSVAAVLVGFGLLARWLEEQGQPFPLSTGDLSACLVRILRDQAVEVDEATPGQLFLEALRSLIASEVARLTEDHGRGVVIGKHLEDKQIICINYKVALSLIHQQLQLVLPPEKSILHDLWVRDMIGESNSGRRTYRIRLSGGSLVQTWALRDHLLLGDAEDLEAAC